MTLTQISNFVFIIHEIYMESVIALSRNTKYNRFVSDLID